MKWSSCIPVLLAAGLTLAAERSEAQPRTSFAVDVTVGAGNGKGGEFFDRDILGGVRVR
jgi:hypothetical protein